MDREELRQAAAKRRSAAAEAPKKVEWNCSFCSRTFLRESAFMNHTCPGKKRLEDMRSQTGQSAYAYYAEWMRVKRHTVPPPETFMESRLFTTFLKFAKHVEAVKLPNVNQFIKSMVDSNDIPPSLWCRDSTYSMYLKLYDDLVPPMTQVSSTIDELFDLMVEHKVQGIDLFKTIGSEVLLKLLQKRKVSGWFLMASDAFARFYHSLPPTEKMLFQRELNYVAEKVARNGDILEKCRECAKEMGL